jgi:hypothetical protein
MEARRVFFAVRTESETVLKLRPQGVKDVYY